MTPPPCRHQDYSYWTRTTPMLHMTVSEHSQANILAATILMVNSTNVIRDQLLLVEYFMTCSIVIETSICDSVITRSETWHWGTNQRTHCREGVLFKSVSLHWEIRYHRVPERLFIRGSTRVHSNLQKKRTSLQKTPHRRQPPTEQKTLVFSSS